MRKLFFGCSYTVRDDTERRHELDLNKYSLSMKNPLTMWPSHQSSGEPILPRTGKNEFGTKGNESGTKENESGTKSNETVTKGNGITHTHVMNASTQGV